MAAQGNAPATPLIKASRTMVAHDAGERDNVIAAACNRLFCDRQQARPDPVTAHLRRQEQRIELPMVADGESKQTSRLVACNPHASTRCRGAGKKESGAAVGGDLRRLQVSMGFVPNIVKKTRDIGAIRRFGAMDAGLGNASLACAKSVAHSETPTFPANASSAFSKHSRGAFTTPAPT